MLCADRLGRTRAGYFPAALGILIGVALFPGAASGGMGNTGVGVPDSTGNISDNPAAAAASGIRFDEAAVYSELSWSRMAFAGNVFNPASAVNAKFDLFSGLQFSAVSPQIKSGRIGAGLWQLERRALEFEEPLNLALSLTPAIPAPLSGSYETARTDLGQSEETYALGAVWIQELPVVGMRAALGGAYVTHALRSSIQARGLSLLTGDEEQIFRLVSRRNLDGFAAVAGFFYRPFPDYSFGVSFMHVGPLSGQVVEQAEGGPLYIDRLKRPSQARIGVGGAVTMMTDLLISAEFHYLAGIDMTATLFSGTPAEVSFREKSETGIGARLEAAYPVRIAGVRIPLRAGFFMQPDALPAQTDGIAVSALSQFRPVSFVQDVLGWTVGGTWEEENLKLTVSLYWLQVNTHVKQQSPSGWVDSADARNSLGASAGVSLRFGKNRSLEGP